MIILSTPFTLAAVSARALVLLPAMKPVMDLPSFWAAVMAQRDEFCNAPSLCSRTASELRSLARVEGWWSWWRAWRCSLEYRKPDLLPIDSIVLQAYVEKSPLPTLSLLFDGWTPNLMEDEWNWRSELWFNNEYPTLCKTCHMGKADPYDTGKLLY